MWRFYGYYGGLNTVGNLANYGQFADDSTFEVIPPWHNKLQAMAYEDAIYTRNSHYSYEIKNNKLFRKHWALLLLSCEIITFILTTTIVVPLLLFRYRCPYLDSFWFLFPFLGFKLSTHT